MNNLLALISMNLRVAVAVLLLTGQMLPAAAIIGQKTPALDLMIQKARSLEARDRDDLAAQVWQQVLIANPNQPDALAGLARWAKQGGRSDEANTYLSRLRRVAPDASALTQAPVPPHSGSLRLSEAGKLAAGQHFVEAMAIYREVFGSKPPAGGWAVAYYETMSYTPGGFEPAVAALKGLATSYPGVQDYQVAAGKLMTFRPQSRKAGIELLSAVQGSTMAASNAKAAWRQALVWEKGNPSYAPALQNYLIRYEDPDLKAQALKTPAGMRAEPLVAGNSEEQLGYRALKTGDTAEAERQFNAALGKNQANGRARAGVGFVHMKNSDFAAAVEDFEAAEKASPGDATVRRSLESARFWQAMRLGAKASDEEKWSDATTHFQSALTLRPKDHDAFRAMGGALLAAGMPGNAVPFLLDATKAQPADQSAWCALFQAKLQSAGGRSALDLLRSVPAAAGEALSQNVSWQAQLSLAYVDAGDDQQALKIYRAAIAGGQHQLSPDEELVLASLALQFNEPERALPYARGAFESSPAKPAVWENLLAALVGTGRLKEAERVYSRIPESLQAIVLSHSAFKETQASLKEAGGDLDGAALILGQLVNSPSTSSARQVSVSARIHLAQLLAKLGRPAEAESMLTAILDAHPDDVTVWRSYLQLLQNLHLENDVVVSAGRMPQAVAVGLARDGDMVSLLAHAQVETGHPEQAVRLLQSYLAQPSLAKHSTSDSTDGLSQRIQLGWLLLESPSASRNLFNLLDQMDNRSDLSPTQRQEISGLWSTWIVRSAETARKSGHEPRALALLDEGCRRFPNNPALLRGLAGNLLAAGNNKRALAVYSNWGLAEAQADDYAGAIGAALAEHNTAYADSWIVAALTSWPTDPKLLSLAGDRAQSQGNLKKAQLFWKQALLEKQAQPADVTQGDAVIAADASLRTLLVGPGAAPHLSNNPDIHLSSFQTGSEPREDFVRPAASSSFLPTGSTLFDPGTFLKQPAPGPSISEELQDKIAAVEGRDSPFLGSGMTVLGRGGEAGFSRLISQRAEFEASTTLAGKLRVSLLLKPTYLTSGTASGTGDSLFGRQTAPASFGSQTASGVEADAELSSRFVGARVGTTPDGFLTRNWLGGFRLQPGNGSITILLDRDSVKDTMLSYAGVRDPETKQISGGVMADTASVLGNWGSPTSGAYVSGGYQLLTGENVARNTAVSATVGAWWKVLTATTGSLTVGMNFSAMHYDRNLRYFTFGQGGYFSPQQYFLFSAPVRWTGIYGHRLQYSVGGSVGSQHFTEDASDYYPSDSSLQNLTNSKYAAFDSTGLNFNFDTHLSYQMTPHWFLGAFATANNARNYTSASSGLFVKYTFEERPLSFENTVPAVPDWRGQQPFTIY